jgi:hypothetical protein
MKKKLEKLKNLLSNAFSVFELNLHSNLFSSVKQRLGSHVIASFDSNALWRRYSSVWTELHHIREQIDKLKIIKTKGRKNEK